MIAMIAMEPNLFYQFIYALVAYYLVKQFYIGVEHADTRHIIPALAIMAFGAVYGIIVYIISVHERREIIMTAKVVRIIMILLTVLLRQLFYRIFIKPRLNGM